MSYNNVENKIKRDAIINRGSRRKFNLETIINNIF